MSVFERLTRRVGLWFLPESAGRAEIIQTAIDVAESRSFGYQVREIVDIGATGIRLRVRFATDDRPAKIVLQGLVLGVILLVALAGLGSSTLGLSERLPLAVVPLIVMAVTVVLLIVGMVDPRSAIAATVLLTWRLVLVDGADLGRAVEVFGREFAVESLLIRMVAMASGILFAIAISVRSMDRVRI